MMTCLLSACAANKAKMVAVAPPPPTQPCWIENPVAGGTTGQIGRALDLWTGGEQPVIKSKRRALGAFGQYFGMDHTDIELTRDTAFVVMGGKTVYLSPPYRRNGQLLTYASDHPVVTPELCPVSTCSISRCDPAWLCASSSEGELTQIGVSYLTANPTKQHEHAISNAQNIARLLYGTQVSASKSLKTVNTNTGTLTFMRSTDELNALSQENLPYLVTNSCRNGETLFTRVRFKSDGYQPTFTGSPSLWLTNPKYQGIDGAVGSAEKRVASGLFSRQIDLAIRRAIIQLALEKESNLSEDLLNIEYGQGGTLMVSTIHEQTQVTLRAALVALHITGTDDDQPKVYAWVARIKN